MNLASDCIVVPPTRFDLAEAERAGTAWGFNCGPAALCALLNLTPRELRPHLREFEQRGYMGPTMMRSVLEGIGASWRVVWQGKEQEEARAARYPAHGLVRIQWGGPWMRPHVPVAARYQHTHWIAVIGAGVERPVLAFDINAICAGGWIAWEEWERQLAPWLLREGEPLSDGTWWPTHCWQVDPDRLGAGRRA